MGEGNRAQDQPARAAAPPNAKARIRTAAARALFAKQHGRETADAGELSDFIARQSRLGSRAVAGFDLDRASTGRHALSEAFEAHRRLIAPVTERGLPLSGGTAATLQSWHPLGGGSGMPFQLLGPVEVRDGGDGVVSIAGYRTRTPRCSLLKWRVLTPKRVDQPLLRDEPVCLAAAVSTLRIAESVWRGLPVWGDLEYTDEVTHGQACSGRRRVE
jgi:hypothetical protein